jgi:hypothetical protein
MNRRVLILVLGLGLAGCGAGEKARELKNATNAVTAAAEAGNTLVNAQNEAEKFYAERKAKGDTIAIPYADLQKFIPAPPSDYTPLEAPGGSSQTMGAWSMSQTEQTFSKAPGPDGTAPTIKVTIVDFGGTQAAYGMMAAPLMMNLSQEDAHHKMQTLKLSTPYTWGSEDFNKDDKSSTVTLVTRYRYVVTVEARNQGQDNTAMARALAEDIAKKFDGK